MLPVCTVSCSEGPGLKNKNRPVLKEEGSGRRLKPGPEGHRWEMGGWRGGGSVGVRGGDTWFLLLTSVHVDFCLLLSEASRSCGRHNIDVLTKINNN